MDRSSNTQIYTTGPTFIKQKSTSFLFIQNQHTCKWSKKGITQLLQDGPRKRMGLFFIHSYLIIFILITYENIPDGQFISASVQAKKQKTNQTQTYVTNSFFTFLCNNGLLVGKELHLILPTGR